MKNDAEVRQDIYAIVVSSPIKDAISGEVRIIPRAKGSNAEDCIISVQGNLDGQIQNCIVYVNVYVQNINNRGESVENVARTSMLAKLCEDTLQSGYGNGFRYYIESQRISAVNGKDEHVIVNKLHYKFNNEEKWQRKKY